MEEEHLQGDWMRKTRESYDKEKVETKGMLSKRVSGHLMKEKRERTYGDQTWMGESKLGRPFI